MPAGNAAKSKASKLATDLGRVMLATFFNETRPIKGLFVGVESGAYIILRFPSSAAVEDHLYEGNPVVIKYIADGTVYGFQSSVLGYVYKKKLILVVLSFPENLETHQLRESHRVDFLVPAVLEASGKIMEGFVVDISAGGCGFRFDSSQHDGTPDFGVVKDATISFQIVGREGTQDFGCKVMNVSTAGFDIGLGLKFDHADEDITEGIRDYIRQVNRFFDHR